MHRTVSIAGEPVRVERVSARKASRAFALLRHINARSRDLTRSVDRFDRDWREEHVTYLTRVEARVRYPARVVLDPDTSAPVKDPDTGELVYQPSPVDAMTDADWQAAGDRYPVHETAPGWALMQHAFEDALELAEAHVYRLLALLLMGNDEVKARHRDGSLDDALDQAADELLDAAMADEVLELAVAAAEVLDEQFRSKLDELGDRTGNVLRLFGMGKATTATSTPPSGPTTSTPDSSTDTPSRSEPDGPPTSSSTPTTSSSNGSASSPTPPAPTPELEPTPSA